jgi:hypothetical protein
LLSTKDDLIYAPGAGTDSSEGGPMMWKRVKGKTENALLQMSFKGYIHVRSAASLFLFFT